MKISIKYKFSIFLTFLLLTLTGVLSYLVLDSISNFQLQLQENTLKSQREKAELYFREAYRSSGMSDSESTYIKQNGQDISASISILCDMNVELFDLDHKKIGTTTDISEQMDISLLFDYVKNDREAYIKTKDNIYYLAQLTGIKSQIGYIEFKYAIKNDLIFYSTIKGYLYKIGIVAFIISLGVSLLYFSSYVLIILSLKKNINAISEGDYTIKSIDRRDEFGDLSRGIFNMGNQIQKNLNSIESEKINLKLAIDKLHILGKQQKQFIGNITHEFKTPLTSIKAYVDLLNIYRDDPKLIEDAIFNLDKETNRLMDMVEKILKLKSIERYSFEYTCEIVKVKVVLEDTINRLRGKASKFGMSITSQIEDAKIFVERESFVHIFVNLIDNAIKYNKQNGTISVKAVIEEAFFNIFVCDTGIGILPEYWDMIFEPFFRVNKHKNNIYGGTGLGLSIVKEMVEKQGGTIKVIKSDQLGTTFLVQFPIFL